MSYLYKTLLTLDERCFGIVVYFWTRDNQALYVGVSTRGIFRLTSHHAFKPELMGKLDRITVWTGFKTIQEALAFESDLIRTYRPLYNKAVPVDKYEPKQQEPLTEDLDMKKLMQDFEGMTDEVGDERLKAWPTSEGSCRIQTSDPKIAKALAKVSDIKTVGFSVKGRWVRIFALPYTLDWVGKNVIQKINLQFPRENEGSKTEIATT